MKILANCPRKEAPAFDFKGIPGYLFDPEPFSSCKIGCSVANFAGVLASPFQDKGKAYRQGEPAFALFTPFFSILSCFFAPVLGYTEGSF